jgi:N utilization substance protein A
VSILDEEQRIMEVVVEDKQLSLAIGKKGQNVRLAAKIVGWRIDIKSEEEKRQEVEAEMARMARVVDELRSLEGVATTITQKLIDAGIGGLDHLLQMSDEELLAIEGVGDKTVEKIREAAVAAKETWDRRDADERARLESADESLAEGESLEGESLEGETAVVGEPAAEPSSEGDLTLATEHKGDGGETDGER